MAIAKNMTARGRRKQRIRKKISGTGERPRMCVFRSNRNIAVQIIDDLAGKTLVAASTLEKDLRGQKHNSSMEGAKKIGELIADRAKVKGVETVVFDRSGYRYHGRIRALADAARKNGLRF